MRDAYPIRREVCRQSSPSVLLTLGQHGPPNGSISIPHDAWQDQIAQLLRQHQVYAYLIHHAIENRAV
jgi:hypothetical protein